jgi:hypothetical protein
MSNSAQQKHLDSIAGMLLRYRYFKNELDIVKQELRRAVYECGVPQEEIAKMSVNDFLDGYLIANGIVQPYRLEK